MRKTKPICSELLGGRSHANHLVGGARKQHGAQEEPWLLGSLGMMAAKLPRHRSRSDIRRCQMLAKSLLEPWPRPSAACARPTRPMGIPDSCLFQCLGCWGRRRAGDATDGAGWAAHPRAANPREGWQCGEADQRTVTTRAPHACTATREEEEGQVKPGGPKPGESPSGRLGKPSWGPTS